MASNARDLPHSSRQAGPTWAYIRQGVEAVQEDGAHGPEFYEAFARRDRDLYKPPVMPGLPS